MQVIETIIKTLIADDGKVVTDGISAGRVAHLGDTPDGWSEITAEEATARGLDIQPEVYSDEISDEYAINIIFNRQK